jgi:hypothetical protein
VGIERINVVLGDCSDIRESLPNIKDTTPFRFDPNDLVEVIGALHDYAAEQEETPFNSATDFDVVKLKQKSEMNGLSEEYFREIIVNGSMQHFDRIANFLKNPRNKGYASQYHDAADELKEKILVSRSKFETFDHVFAYMYEAIQAKRTELKGKRRLVSILLHYMYCNCDIGSKSFVASSGTSHAHS